ncbi:MAG TPA: hypothetical protein EYP85_09675 [Armatimonadetes bacterium]|nr:hypothetical protein [Armatimonadota bacterium]
MKVGREKLKILAVSDMHGQLEPVHRLVAEHTPDLLLCCGDWGDPGEVLEEDLLSLQEQTYILTVFGNHDDRDLLARLRNRDGSPILLEQGELREVGGLHLAGISGIWAKSHRRPHYVTEEDVAAFVERLQGQPLEVLLTHGCPVGLADRTPRGTHGGKRCFLHAFRTLAPQVHLCGHLHLQQQYQTKSGQIVLNIGYTAAGDYALLWARAGTIALEFAGRWSP